MIRRVISNTTAILSLIGVTISLVALGFVLTKRLGISTKLFIAIASLGVGLLLGICSKYLTPVIRKLQTTRRIFLSHSHPVTPLMQEIYRDLHNSGAKVWVDFERIKPGMDWRLSLEKAIKDADVFVVLLSGEPNPNLMYELGLARALRLKIIPVLLESVELPSDIATLHYIDLRENPETGINKLIDAVK